MELNKIEGLLEKYDEGATLLIEEAQLRNYFSQETVPHHLEPYKQLYSYFESDTKQLAQRAIKLSTEKPKRYRLYASVAASIVILFTRLLQLLLLTLMLKLECLPKALRLYQLEKY